MTATLSRRTVIAAAAAAAGSVAAPAFAQKSASAAWPTRTVRILVGFPGGSTPDLVARTIAETLSKMLGQPVIVENKPGASGNIATDQLAKATDYITIVVLINGNMTIAKLLNPATPYDPAKNQTPQTLIG